MLGMIISSISSPLYAANSSSGNIGPVAGKDYELLEDNAVSESAQITLYCWLGSKGCYLFDMALAAWAERNALEVKYIPLIKRPTWRRLAKAQLVAQQLAIAPEFNRLINQHLHEQQQPIDSDERLFELVSTIDTSASRFANLFYSAETNLAINELQLQANNNRVEGVPTVVVNNRWLIDARMHTTSRGMLNTVADLLAIEKP